MVSLSTRMQSDSLSLICLVEIAERFSFHVMRGIVVLYMIRVFHFTDSFAYAVFASFTALLYFTPLIGGFVSDKYISKKQAVVLGGLTLSLGYFLLYHANATNLYFSLALITMGNGLFMPNIANCVGEIYHSTSAERESAFSIFYMALNIGAFLPPFITTWIILLFNWQSAFLFSSLVMLLTSFFYVYFHVRRVTINKNTWLSSLYIFITVILLAFVFSFLIKYTNFTYGLLCSAGLILIVFIFKKSTVLNSIERNRLSACVLLTIFSILFWTMAEQSAMSLAVFTEYNTDRQWFNVTISTLYFFSLNPLFIILLGPIFSKIWIWLDKKNLNPSIPSKFAIGTILMGIGFVILPIAISLQNKHGLINPIWLLLSYFLQACGELVFSPIGLSMIVELSPKNIVGLMMGLWYFSTSIAYLLAGYTSQLTTSTLQNNQTLLTSGLYSHIFGSLGWLAIAAGIAILFAVPFLNNLMMPEPLPVLAHSQE